MTQPFIRAAIFAVLSMIVLAALSALAFVLLIGMPGTASGMADFQAKAAGMAPKVDLVLGGLVMLLCGWLAARPFAGRAAVQTGVLVGVFYIVLDVVVVLLFGDVHQMSIGTTGVSYIVKLAAAAIGGLIAARAIAPVRNVAPGEP